MWNNIAGFAIGHSNSLGNQLTACCVSGAPVAVHVIDGGSFKMVGGACSATDCDFVIHGIGYHTNQVVGTLMESGSNLLRVTGGMYVHINFSGISKSGLSTVPGETVIDVSGSLCVVNISDSNLSDHLLGLTIRMTDTGAPTNPVGPLSYINIHNSQVYVDTLELNQAALSSSNVRWSAAHDGTPHETLSNGARVISQHDAGIFAAYNTQHTYGAYRGVSGISSTAVEARHLAGSVSFGAADTTQLVTFALITPALAEYDADYLLTLGVENVTGVPAAGSMVPYVGTKLAQGFYICVPVAPGVGAGFDVVWHLLRGGGAPVNWTPAALGATAVWLRPDSTSRTVVAGHITALTDKIGGVIDAGDWGAAPAVDDTGLWPCAACDGTNSMPFAAGELASANTSHTFWFAYDAVDDAGGNQSIIDIATGVDRLWLTHIIGGGHVGWYDHVNAAVEVVASQIGRQWLVFQFDSATSIGTLYRNGVLVGTGAYHPLAITDSSAFLADRAGNSCLNGKVYDWGWRPSLLTAGELASLHGYLARYT
jgi:hypothetical protein